MRIVQCASLLHTPWVEAARLRSRPQHALPRVIADDLRRRIARGDLQLGQQLPSIRKLAGTYGVSVPTMGAALQVLASLGLVRASRGVGTFVAGPNPKGGLVKYAWRAASLHELAIIRSAVDDRAPIMLAARTRQRRPRGRQPRAWADLNYYGMERSAERLGSVERFVSADLAFHRTMLIGLHGLEIGPALYERIGRRLRVTLEAAAPDAAQDDRLDAAHRRLVTAVMQGDVRSAERASRLVAGIELRSTEAALG